MRIEASRKASRVLNNIGGKKQRTQSRRQKEERFRGRILPYRVLFLCGSLLTLTFRVKRPCDTAELVCVCHMENEFEESVQVFPVLQKSSLQRLLFAITQDFKENTKMDV